MGKVMDRLFGKLRERARVAVSHGPEILVPKYRDKLGFKTATVCDKFRWNGPKLPLAEMLADTKRYGHFERLVVAGNLITNAGENLALDLLTGAGNDPLDTSTGYMGVGNSATAADETDTGLNGASQDFQILTSVTVTNDSCEFVASWASGEGNFAWEEWGLANGNNPPTTGDLFNHKVSSLGTKSSGTWQLTVTITAS